MARTIAERLARRLAGPGETDDLPEAVRPAEPANFLAHAGALIFSKTADGLIDPKLVLSWLLAQGGAGAGFVGLLVPVREAGALLPQLLVSARLAAMPRRKWAWVAGSAVQGAMVAAICLAGLTLEGPALGFAVLAALAVLALARSVCSVSHKDVLGRTVARGHRGAVSGLAGSVAAGAVLIFAAVLLAGPWPRRAVVLAALALAALSFGLAAALMARVVEAPAPANEEGEPGGFGAVIGQLAWLRRDPRLARFVLARGLMTATALAPPYVVLAAGAAAGSAAPGMAEGRALGAMVLASALAALLSAYVWGRLADRSSRRVLILAGLLGAAGMGLALALGAAGTLASAWAPALALFVLSLAHQGVRIGRATWLVDMAPEDRRAAYTSVSNTVIGVVLLATGGLGALAAAAGPEAALALFAAMALAASAAAWTLPEA